MKKVILTASISLAFFIGLSFIRNYIGEQFFPNSLATKFVDIVESRQEIKFPFFYGRTFNPGIIAIEGGYLLSFRSNTAGVFSWIKHNLLLERKIYLNFITLDQSFSPKGKISSFAQGGQDARLIEVKGGIYAVYNDESQEETLARRMFISEVVLEDKQVRLCPKKKLTFPKTKEFAERGLITSDREKNWSPFVYEGALYFVYLINPHVILKADLETGVCREVIENQTFPFWSYNVPRGGTPALLVGDEYLTFFHADTSTESRWHKRLDRGGYYFGAYSFAKEFPFQITRRTTLPLYPKHLPWARRKIVYPSGFIVKDNRFFLFAGVTDRSVYVFEIKKEKLDLLLQRVE